MPNRDVRAKASAFQGLNNVRDPRTMGPSWLRVADNVDITDTQHIVRRPGHTRVAEGTFRAAFVTQDETSAFVASPTTLYLLNPDYTLEPVAELDPAAPVRFLEVNHRVYVLNGYRHLVLEGARTRPWGLPVPQLGAVERHPGTMMPAGEYSFAVSHVAEDGRESGLSQPVVATADGPTAWRVFLPQEPGLRTALYMSSGQDSVLYRVTVTQQPVLDLSWDSIDSSISPTTTGCSPPPPGGVLAFHQGRVLIGDSFPEQRMSLIWQSDPLSYELFQLDRGYIPVPGEVRMLHGTPLGLLIGTDREVLLWTPQEEMTTLFSYGVPPGSAIREADDGALYFWTDRGLCTVGEEGFQNIMDRVYSPEKAVSASLAVMELGGYRKVLALLQQTGAPYNAWRKD